MTPRKQFLRRVVASIRYQRHALSLVVDWVVALYFIVPGLIIGGIAYARLWIEPPVWLGMIPTPVLWIGIGLVALSMSNRYFIASGDQLFVIYNRVWIRAFYRYGLIYSFVVRVAAVAGVTMLLLPAFAVTNNLTILQLVCICGYAIALSGAHSVLNERIQVRWKGWKMRGVLILTFASALAIFVSSVLLCHSNTFVLLMLVAISTGAYFALSAWRIGWTVRYAADAEAEYAKKTRFTSLIMREDPAFRTPSRRKRPILFRRSRRMFRKMRPANGVSEALIKAFFRSRSQMVTYAQLTFAALGGLLLAPLVSKIILTAFVVLLLALWMKRHAREALSDDFMAMFALTDSVKNEAVAKTTFWIVLPAYMALGIVLGYFIYGWVGILVMAVAAPILGKAVTGIVSSF